MFGRRKSVMPKGRVKPVAPKPRLKPKPPAAKQAPVREPVRASHFSQHVLPIIVQQEEYDRGGADLVYAIVRYMNLMMEDGCYAQAKCPHTPCRAITLIYISRRSIMGAIPNLLEMGRGRILMRPFEIFTSRFKR